MTFKDWMQDMEAAAFHEAGHAFIATEAHPEAFQGATIYSDKAGWSGQCEINMKLIPDVSDRYEVAVAGSLSEARCSSQMKLNDEDIQTVAQQVITSLATGESRFVLEIPLEGDGMAQAACSASDFEWLDGLPADEQMLREALRKTAVAMNTAGTWRRIKDLARKLCADKCLDASDL